MIRKSLLTHAKTANLSSQPNAFWMYTRQYTRRAHDIVVRARKSKKTAITS
jgi:hypothetical protein